MKDQAKAMSIWLTGAFCLLAVMGTPLWAQGVASSEIIGINLVDENTVSIEVSTTNDSDEAIVLDPQIFVLLADDTESLPARVLPGIYRISVTIYRPRLPIGVAVVTTSSGTVEESYKKPTILLKAGKKSTNSIKLNFSGISPDRQVSSRRWRYSSLSATNLFSWLMERSPVFANKLLDGGVLISDVVKHGTIRLDRHVREGVVSRGIFKGINITYQSLITNVLTLNPRKASSKWSSARRASCRRWRFSSERPLVDLRPPPLGDFGMQNVGLTGVMAVKDDGFSARGVDERS